MPEERDPLEVSQDRPRSLTVVVMDEEGPLWPVDTKNWGNKAPFDIEPDTTADCGCHLCGYHRHYGP